MGYFSSYFGGSKPTKILIAGRIAALIKCVMDDVRVNGLIAGSIVLNSNFTVAFRGGGEAQDTESFANVSLNSELKKTFSSREIQSRGNWLLSDLDEVSRLTSALINEFEKQSPKFARLESKHKPFKLIGGYVVVGKSAQYREAEKKCDKNEMENLLRKAGKLHYLMETYESMGEAKVRERNIASAFVGGIVDSYEVLI